MTPRPRRAADQRGFVLVGVVVFVIALTIVGLSLFSLSSYEAQFLQSSIDAEQAYQSAMGGLEHARVALCQVDPTDANGLQAPGRGLPIGDIVAAVAIQDKGGGVLDSTGAVVWDPSTTILLRATARRGSQVCTVQGAFVPALSRSPYTYLFSVSGQVRVDDVFPPPPDPAAVPRRFTTNLSGPMWQAGAPVDTSWATPGTSILTGWTRGIRTAALATPDLASYFAANFGGAKTVDRIQRNGGPPTYVLQSNQDHPRWFRLNDDGSYFLYRYVEGEPEPVFEVAGLAVLEFPHGARFEPKFKVTGTGSGTNDVLVVVAGPIGTTFEYEQDPQMGFRAFGGIQVDPSVTLIVVSSGNVYLQQYNHPSQIDSYVSDLTVYAGNLELAGPQNPPAAGESPHAMMLAHSGAIQGPGNALERLATYGALPGVSAITERRLEFVHGTWSGTRP